MKGYEQLEFEETRNLARNNAYDETMQKCFDCNGREINIGDYVVAVSGKAKFNCIEGVVTKIFSDFECSEITVSTYGGEVLDERGDSFCYEIKYK